MDVDNEYGALEMQKKCMILLKEFHHFCIENDIEYSVAYGTLLGTVRHKGFIPWDDDIDIILDRKNYGKLLKAIDNNSTLAIERMTPHSLWIDRITLKDDTSIVKSTIDVFLLDKSPDSFLYSNVKIIMIMFLQGMMKATISPKGSLILRCASFVSLFCGKFFSLKRKYKWYQSVSCWGNQNETEYEQCYNIFFTSLRHKFKKGMLDVIVLKPFENFEVKAIDDYDLFLIPEYGDYMTLPSNRIPKHSVQK